MEQASPKSGHLSGGERVAEFLQARHPTKTAEHVEAATRGAVPADSIRKLLVRKNAPSFATMVALISAYGPEFLAAAMPRRLGWLSAAERAERLALVEAEHARLEGEIARLRGGM